MGLSLVSGFNFTDVLRDVISLIVPAHNEEDWIGRSLLAIRDAMRAVNADHEVIVVNDASTDRTELIACEYGARLLQVAHRQISAARNAGAKEARGEILFFIDADTLINSAAVRAALRAIDEGAAGGGCVPRFEGRLPLWFRIFYPLMVFTIRRLLRQTGGACLFCTRQAFAATGGFSEAHYAAEEDVWVKALKRHGRFVVLNETVVTSGRSLRTQSFWTIGRLFLRLAFRGADGFRQRDGLDLWYRPSRETIEGPK